MTHETPETQWHDQPESQLRDTTADCIVEFRFHHKKLDGFGRVLLLPPDESLDEEAQRELLTARINNAVKSGMQRLQEKLDELEIRQQ